MLTGIVWKLWTGVPWRDLPERYRPHTTAHERLRLWIADGTWDKILAEVIVRDEAVGELEWVISVASSVVRAHQHAAGGRKRGCTATVDALAVEGEGLGRSRGGLSTKIHLAVDRRGRPLRVLLTPGQAGDNPQHISSQQPTPNGKSDRVCAIIRAQLGKDIRDMLLDPRLTQPQLRADLAIACSIRHQAHNGDLTL